MSLNLPDTHHRGKDDLPCLSHTAHTCALLIKLRDADHLFMITPDKLRFRDEDFRKQIKSAQDPFDARKPEFCLIQDGAINL